jgi:hypothetical protein
VQDDENTGEHGVNESSAYYYDDSTGYEVYEDDANREPANEDEDRSSDS